MSAMLTWRDLPFPRDIWTWELHLLEKFNGDTQQTPHGVQRVQCEETGAWPEPPTSVTCSTSAPSHGQVEGISPSLPC